MLTEKVFEVIREIIDNDTLIIVSVSVLAFISPEHRELVAGALVGYLGSRIRKQNGNDKT